MEEVRGTGPLGEIRTQSAEFPVRLRVWALCELLGHLPRVDARYKLGVIERAGPTLEVEAREFRSFTSEVHASIELGLVFRIREKTFLSASGNFGNSLSRGRICEASKSKQRYGCDAMHSIHTA
ncbi:hypothetical protein SXANM310S_00460 [Streptomyces xanthochromogenes]